MGPRVKIHPKSISRHPQELLRRHTGLRAKGSHFRFVAELHCGGRFLMRNAQPICTRPHSGAQIRSLLQNDRLFDMLALDLDTPILRQ